MGRQPDTRLPAVGLAAILAGLLGACAGEATSPTSPVSAAPAPPTVSAAEVLVGGRPVGSVVTRGTDEPSLFRVRVNAPGGLGTIRRVVLAYDQPGPNHHGGPPMGGFRGTVLCYDDGTHGDDVPGDGIYHFLDPDNRIGCHGIDAPAGEYRYSFWCEDVWGQTSPAVSITIVRE